MRHVDPDRLALLALGETAGAEDAEVAAHLYECAACRAEVEALRHTATLGRESVEHRHQTPPPPVVWDRIAAELAAELSPAPPQPARPQPARPQPARPQPARPAPAGPVAAGPQPAGPQPGGPQPAGPSLAGPVNAGPPAARPSGRRRASDRRPAPRRPAGRAARRRGWVRSAVALVAAAAVGAVATLGVLRPWQDEPAPAPASIATLDPVAGGPRGVTGRAVVVDAAAGPVLQVTANGLPLQPGYYEVWVFDGRQNMVSVGVLGTDSRAALPLPPTLDLRTYHIVDISAEPYDGDQTHSQDSVLRGSLTN